MARSWDRKSCSIQLQVTVYLICTDIVIVRSQSFRSLARREATVIPGLHSVNANRSLYTLRTLHTSGAVNSRVTYSRSTPINITLLGVSLVSCGFIHRQLNTGSYMLMLDLAPAVAAAAAVEAAAAAEAAASTSVGILGDSGIVVSVTALNGLYEYRRGGSHRCLREILRGHQSLLSKVMSLCSTLAAIANALLWPSIKY